jgi:hypothetical protein
MLPNLIGFFDKRRVTAFFTAAVRLVAAIIFLPY